MAMDRPYKSAGMADEGDILANNPRAINVAEFASARAAELKTMTEAVMTMGGMRRTFQKLPRHLRRRAMSHDLRRLPKRLRDSEQRAMLKGINPKKSAKGKEVAGDDEAPPVKRSRRHRRRPGNLRQEYQRRQHDHVWLETHIWHAKRFKMAQLWGHKIALHPSDKSARATYRAMAKHCLLQDISYLQVIEVRGPQGVILKALTHLTSSLTGLTCAAASYLTGLRHGETTFYENDRFPEGAVGPVNFLWKAKGIVRDPPTGGNDETRKGRETVASGPGDKFGEISERTLWLWAHPSCSSQLLKELLRAVDKEEHKDTDCRVRVRELEDRPLRFRLQGPLSHPVLQDALKTADVGVACGPDQARTWWEDYYATPDRMNVQAAQSSAWEGLGGDLTSANLPPRCVLGLTVRDPRNLLPIKKLKVTADAEDLDHTDQLPGNVMQHFPLALSSSPLWEESVRHSVTESQIPIHKLNKMRADLLVPGQELHLGRQESRIPVLLLQQPGTSDTAESLRSLCHQSKWQGRAGFGSGWDVILPKGWGMAFWIALIFRGARAAGLRESRSCHLQRGLPHFPEACPDATPGAEWEDAVQQELARKFQRWPPAKRPNYGKLGIVSPFRCPWKELLEEWRDAKKVEMDDDDGENVDDSSKDKATDESSDISEPFKEKDLSTGEASNRTQTCYVLRERSKLEKLREALLAKHKPLRVPKAVTKQAGPFGAAGSSMGMLKPGVKAEALETSNGHAALPAPSTTRKDTQIVSSKLSDDTLLSQNADRALVGVRLQMANRGVPNAFAMICLPSDNDIASFTLNQSYSPTEPIHKGFKLQKTAKKKTRKLKKNQSTDGHPSGPSKYEGVKLLDSCVRRAIGFVTDGANAFVSGRGQAVGYCCMLGLLTLIEERPLAQGNLVLVRDAKSVQYRFAYLDVIT